MNNISTYIQEKLVINKNSKNEEINLLSCIDNLKRYIDHNIKRLKEDGYEISNDISPTADYIYIDFKNTNYGTIIIVDIDNKLREFEDEYLDTIKQCYLHVNKGGAKLELIRED